MAIQPTTVYYPPEDGKLTETDRHYKQCARLVEALDLYFANRADVFVGGNIALFYERGNPRKYFGPDVLVAFGVPREKERSSYLLWEEGVAPAVIIELTSASTRQEDTVRKPRAYAQLSVQEYYLFDPLGEFLQPRLQGYHLAAPGQYERLVGAEFDSPALGLRLVMRDDWLRLLNPTTGELLPTLEEAQSARREEQAENARLRAELARLRGTE